MGQAIQEWPSQQGSTICAIPFAHVAIVPQNLITRCSIIAPLITR
jgi:hypothetical protein